RQLARLGDAQRDLGADRRSGLRVEAGVGEQSLDRRARPTHLREDLARLLLLLRRRVRDRGLALAIGFLREPIRERLRRAVEAGCNDQAGGFGVLRALAHLARLVAAVEAQRPSP